MMWPVIADQLLPRNQCLSQSLHSFFPPLSNSFCYLLRISWFSGKICTKLNKPACQWVILEIILQLCDLCRSQCRILAFLYVGGKVFLVKKRWGKYWQVLQNVSISWKCTSSWRMWSGCLHWHISIIISCLLTNERNQNSSIQKWAWEEIEGNVPGRKVHRGCKCMGNKASLQLEKELAVLWNSFWWQGVSSAISAFRQPTQYISWE